MPKGKKATKKAAAAPEEEQIPSIFETLGIDDPDGGKKSKKSDDGGGSGGSSDELKALNERLNALERENSALRASTMASLVSSDSGYGGQSAQPPEMKLPELDLSGMPDPSEDRAAYDKELAKRISKHNQDVAKATREYEAQVAKMSQTTDKSGSYDALWDQFAEDYPHLAKHKKLAEVATSTVLEKAKARGVNLDKYMLATPELFFGDIEKEMKKSYGNVLEADETGEGARDEKARAEDEGESDDDEAVRTGGMFGGQESGSKPQKGKADDQPGDFLKDLQDLQRADRFL